MEPSQPTVTAFGLGTAALIMTVFGFTWLGWGGSAEKTFTVTQWIIFYFAALALLAASVRALRRGKALMKAQSAQRDEFWARTRKQFRLITVLEGVGCGIVVFLTAVFHRLDLPAVGVGIATGTILWVTAIYALVRSRTFSRDVATN